jgi:site-specific recombinase XerD
LRAGEILALDVEGVSFDTKTLRVMGKGHKERVVPVGKTALRFLKSYIIAVRPFFVHDPHESALFLDRTGRRYAYHNLQSMIRHRTRKMKFDVHVTAHTFRRSCTTELIRGGANMYHVKELLGHESLDTLKHYARLTIVDLRKTHEKCHPREVDERHITD